MGVGWGGGFNVVCLFENPITIMQASDLMNGVLKILKAGNFCLTTQRPNGSMRKYGVLRFLPNLPGGYDGTAVQSSFLMPGVDIFEKLALCRWFGNTPEQLAFTIRDAAHEICHAIGLGHSNLPNNLMLPTSGATWTDITSEQYTQIATGFDMALAATK